MENVLRYGVISDTHGFLPPAVFPIFDKVDSIFHCGDVGNPRCLEDLKALAPVLAVHGNMDDWPLAHKLAEFEQEDQAFGKMVIYHGTRFGHDSYTIRNGLRELYREAKPRLILFGHTHVPFMETEDGILFLNPGSASLPHSGRKPTVAILEYDQEADKLTARHFEVPQE